MVFSHESLDVYRLAIQYVSWVHKAAAKLQGIHRHARDQWLRASQSIPLNIAEGNGKRMEADRRRYFEIARGSVFECAAIQDVLEAGGVLSAEKNSEKKNQLDRVAAMLTRLGGKGYRVMEDFDYSSEKVDSDSDTDTDRD